MNLSRITLFIIISTVSLDFCAQTKSALEKQKKEIQKEIKMIE